MIEEDHDGDLSWGDVLAVVGVAVICIVGTGYIVLKIVGLL